MKAFLWKLKVRNVGCHQMLLVAWLAILLCLTGCISVPKPPSQFPAWSPINKKSGDPIISGSYQDIGSGFSKDGKYLGQFSLTTVLQIEGPKPATSHDVVVVMGPTNHRLEVRTWRDHQLVSTSLRTYSDSIKPSNCKDHYDIYDGFVLLPLILDTEAGPILPLMFVNYDDIIYLRKAADGSLIVHDLNCESGYTLFVPYHHDLSEWYQFKPVATVPHNAMNAPATSSP